jgi:putative ABC transport system permease protein
MLSAVRLTLPGTAQLHIDAATAGITLGLGCLAGALMGAVSASPLYTMKLGTMLHDGRRNATRGRAARTTWRTLVVAQMTFSFVLLMGSALLWVSLRNLMALDPGFRTDNVTTGVTSLSGPRYAADDAARAFMSRSLDAIRQLPGVVAAGSTTIVPMTRGGQSGLVVADGYVPKPGELPVSGVRSVVTPGYFEAVGTPLIRGRYFDARDDDPASKSIVIDEALARRFWPGGDAVGRRMFCPTESSQLSKIDATTRWLTVIGVVRTARLNGPTVQGSSGTSGTYYVPFAVTAPRDVGYVIRTEREWTGTVHSVRAALAEIDREIALFDIRTLSERSEQMLSSRSNLMHLAMLFAAVGVFLSGLGLYGMLAYRIAQRKREIGVRLAVGGTPRGIVGLVLREGLWLAMAGGAVGAAASVALGRLLASHLYGVTASDPWVLIVMTAALVAVATFACIIPAHHAARVDVMRILRAP